MLGIYSYILSYLQQAVNVEVMDFKVRELTKQDNVDQICKLITNCKKEDYRKCCMKSVTSWSCQLVIICASASLGTYLYGSNDEFKGALSTVLIYTISCLFTEVVFERHHQEFLQLMAQEFKQDCSKYKAGGCYKMWVAVNDNEQVLGCIAIKPPSLKKFPFLNDVKGYLQVLYLRTSSACRRQGIAGALYSSLMKYIKQRSEIKTLILNTAPLYMDAASIFYKKRGFQSVQFNKENVGVIGLHRLLNCDMCYQV